MIINSGLQGFQLFIRNSFQRGNLICSFFYKELELYFGEAIEVLIPLTPE